MNTHSLHFTTIPDNWKQTMIMGLLSWLNKRSQTRLRCEARLSSLRKQNPRAAKTVKVKDVPVKSKENTKASEVPLSLCNRFCDQEFISKLAPSGKTRNTNQQISKMISFDATICYHMLPLFMKAWANYSCQGSNGGEIRSLLSIKIIWCNMKKRDHVYLSKTKAEAKFNRKI